MATVDSTPGSLTDIGIESQPWLYVKISCEPTRVATLWSYALTDYVFKSPDHRRTPTNVLWQP